MKISKLIAKKSIWISGNAVFYSFFLWGCSALPAPPVAVALYDLGGVTPVSASVGVKQTPALSTSVSAHRFVVALSPVASTGLLDTGTMMYYRLAFAGGQQLRPYAQARWSQPPTTLVQQRLREQLGQQRVVLDTTDGVVLPLPQPVLSGQPLVQLPDHALANTAGFTVGGGLVFGGTPHQANARPASFTPQASVVRVELDTFNQVFTAPDASIGVVRWRATALRTHALGEQLLGQQVFAAQSPAPTADAAGGAIALAQATADAAKALDAWLTALETSAAQP